MQKIPRPLTVGAAVPSLSGSTLKAPDTARHPATMSAAIFAAAASMSCKPIPQGLPIA